MAVIVALLLVALVTSTAVFMLAQQDAWLRQVENIGARAQAEAAARAGIEVGLLILARSAVSGDIRGAQALAADGKKQLALKNIVLDVEFSDPQALFNLNNVVRGERASTADLDAFRKLLAHADLPSELANALLDAIDPDSETTYPGGAEDLDYLAMNPPRRAPNRPLLDLNGLARIKGYSPEAIARLRPYVTALPAPTAINVNSAPAELLAAMIPGLDLSVARALVAAREEEPFKDMGAFRAQLPQSITLPRGLFSVAGPYLLLQSRAHVGRAEVSYEALIARENATRPRMVWRRQKVD